MALTIFKYQTIVCTVIKDFLEYKKCSHEQSKVNLSSIL